MERKTKVVAPEGQQVILITRDFELPVELLFKAHEDPALFEEWMSHEHGSTKVVKYEARQHGGWAFNTLSKEGQVVFGAHGVFHAFEPNRKIVRTFEMNDSPYDVQLEFLAFEHLTADTSRLNMQMVFRTGALRDQLLKYPFAPGLSMAHDRLQQIAGKLKPSL